MAKGPLGGISVKAINKLDAFGKTLDDVRIRTKTGALLTFFSIAIICILTLIELIDYGTVYLDTDIMIDKVRDERVTINLNVTFPRVPCFLLSIDVTDISGEHVRDLSHNIRKERLDEKGVPIPGGKALVDMKNDLEKVGKTRGSNFCGSCYGGLEPEGGCCNTCESVRQAYLNRGWAFSNPDSIEQCMAEHWTDRIKDQMNEGCNLSGRIRVKKVVTNLQINPGRSYQANSLHSHELVPYLRGDGQTHDFGHMIHHFRIESDDEYNPSNLVVADRIRKRLGVDSNPLDETSRHFTKWKRSPAHSKTQYMFQYFVKVVATEFHSLDPFPTHMNGQQMPQDRHLQINSHQYSVTSFIRDVSQRPHVTNDEGIELTHGLGAMPGLFMAVDVSPMRVVHTEKHKPFAHFLTTFCGIVGGILTVASLVDSFIFNTLDPAAIDDKR